MFRLITYWFWKYVGLFYILMCYSMFCVIMALPIINAYVILIKVTFGSAFLFMVFGFYNMAISTWRDE